MASSCNARPLRFHPGNGPGSQTSNMADPRGDSTDALHEATARLELLMAERLRAKPGSRKHKALLEEEERLSSRVTTLSRLRTVAGGR